MREIETFTPRELMLESLRNPDGSLPRDLFSTAIRRFDNAKRRGWTSTTDHSRVCPTCGRQVKRMKRKRF